jgi:hypothetical protein
LGRAGHWIPKSHNTELMRRYSDITAWTTVCPSSLRTHLR